MCVFGVMNTMYFFPTTTPGLTMLVFAKMRMYFSFSWQKEKEKMVWAHVICFFLWFSLSWHNFTWHFVVTKQSLVVSTYNNTYSEIIWCDTSPWPHLHSVVQPVGRLVYKKHHRCPLVVKAGTKNLKRGGLFYTKKKEEADFN